jgi:HAD superfamily hydrolase (TIGR01549 family)
LIEAVIFDLDGTLINLPIDYEKLFERFKKIMKTNDINPVTKTISRLDEKTRNRVFEAWQHAELAVFKDMTVNNEGMSLYRKFARKPRALVTMQGKVLVQRTLKHLDMSFDYEVTREDSLDRVQQIKITAEKLKTDLQSVLFIGNTEGDLFAAQEAKCQFLMVEK